jgi:hypothetical protein
MNQKNHKLLMSKLRQPVHISYIAKYILKTTEDETHEILKEYIDNAQIKESEISKGYYVVTNKEI